MKGNLTHLLIFLIGKYLYYVPVELIGQIKSIKNASDVFTKLRISWRDILTEKGVKVLNSILNGSTIFKELNGKLKLIDENYRPPIFSTTLWDYPKETTNIRV